MNSRLDANADERTQLSENDRTGNTMKALWNGAVIAESDDTVVVEGNHYFPRASVHAEYLRPSETTSFCAWKGTANYFTCPDIS